MNVYAVISAGIGTSEAVSLGVRLSAWHDAMVSHERHLRSHPSKRECDDECPHAEAGTLWTEALETFGSRAHELTFLHSRRPASHYRRAGESRRQLISQERREASEKQWRGTLQREAWAELDGRSDHDEVS